MLPLGGLHGNKKGNCQTKKLKSGYGPDWGPGTKINRPADRRSQCNLKLNLRHYTANYRPVLSSERVPYMENKESNCQSKKCNNIWSPAPRGARHHVEFGYQLSICLGPRKTTESTTEFFIYSCCLHS
jgi:hypothetical protein